MEKPRNRAEAVEALVEHGLNEIDAMYGPNGPERKHYHDRAHAEEFVADACAMADLAIAAGKLRPEDKDLLKLAGTYHDWERGRGDENESISANMAAGRMRKEGVFTDNEIQLAHQMIMTTKVSFEDGIMIHANEPTSLLMAIIADADLAALGKPPEEYWDRALCLLKEQAETEEPADEQILEFARYQVTFLENHRFYTEEANKLFPYREDNVVYMQELVSELEAA